MRMTGLGLDLDILSTTKKLLMFHIRYVQTVKKNIFYSNQIYYVFYRLY